MPSAATLTSLVTSGRGFSGIHGVSNGNVLSLYVMLDDGHGAALMLISLARIRLALGDYLAAVDFEQAGGGARAWRH